MNATMMIEMMARTRRVVTSAEARDEGYGIRLLHLATQGSVDEFEEIESLITILGSLDFIESIESLDILPHRRRGVMGQ